MKSANVIIVKKVKGGGHGHHGGAWKVAYADFVTAMMAFFLLLWLLNAVSQEQLEGISDYFAPISTKTATSGGGGFLAGKTVSKKGVFEVDAEQTRTSATISAQPSQMPYISSADEAPPGADATDAEIKEYLRKREQEQFRDAEQQIRQAIAETPDLSQLSKSLLIDNTPDGLRIQIIDQEGLPMFPRGSAEMFDYTRKVLKLVAEVIKRMPQRIDIAGHTDATRYQNDGGYTNWELSADRANAARRVLAQFGVPEDRIARVVGKAATEPLIPTDPEAPGNRRLAVVLLRTAPPDTAPHP